MKRRPDHPRPVHHLIGVVWDWERDPGPAHRRYKKRPDLAGQVQGPLIYFGARKIRRDEKRSKDVAGDSPVLLQWFGGRLTMKKTFKFFYYFYMLTKKGSDPWNCSPPDIARKLVVVPRKLVVTGWQSCKKVYTKDGLRSASTCGKE